MTKNITVLGAGSFGTAIATLLASNGYKIKIWTHEPDVAKDINQIHENSVYLPDIKLEKSITATTDLVEAINNSEWIFEAIPVKFLRLVFQKAKETINIEHKIIILSKGIEQNSFFLPSNIVTDILSEKIQNFEKNNIAIVAGPNFAKEIAQKYQSAAVIASKNLKIAEQLSKIIESKWFKLNLSEDIYGVQVGGAIKNVLTLAIGILKSCSPAQNTQALLLTYGLEEMTKLAIFFGGKKETVYGLSGLGDLVLTCMGSLSRNLKIGKLLGEGKTLEQLHKEFQTLPEGINTVESIYQLIQKNKLDLPIILKTYEIIFGGKSCKELLKCL